MCTARQARRRRRAFAARASVACSAGGSSGTSCDARGRADGSARQSQRGRRALGERAGDQSPATHDLEHDTPAQSRRRGARSRPPIRHRPTAGEQDALARIALREQRYRQHESRRETEQSVEHDKPDITPRGSRCGPLRGVVLDVTLCVRRGRLCHRRPFQLVADGGDGAGRGFAGKRDRAIRRRGRAVDLELDQGLAAQPQAILARAGGGGRVDRGVSRP